MALPNESTPVPHTSGAYDTSLVVEVRNRYDGSWSHGFEIVEAVLGSGGVSQYRLRRLSDGVILPVLFSADDILAREPNGL